MPKRQFSNLLALAVLSCLIEKPMHPYEISQTLRSRGKDHSIKLNYGALYSVVESLARAGLVEARETIREGRRPERTIYAITDAGLAEHEDWLAELVSTPRREYHSLEAALALIAGLPPDEATRLLGVRAVRLRIELGTVEATLVQCVEMGLPQIFVVEEEFRRSMLVAELDHVTRLTEAIKNDALTGITAWRRLHQLVAAGMSFEEIMRDPGTHLGEEAAAFGSLQPADP